MVIGTRRFSGKVGLGVLGFATLSFCHSSTYPKGHIEVILFDRFRLIVWLPDPRPPQFMVVVTLGYCSFIGILISACSTSSTATTLDASTNQLTEDSETVPNRSHSRTSTVPNVSSNAQIAPASVPESPEIDVEDETFLGTKDRKWTLAVIDFEVIGEGLAPETGRIAAARLCSRLDTRVFQLIERSQLGKLIQERDLRSIVHLGDNELGKFGRLANASLLLLGSVTQIQDITLNARIVDVENGRIARKCSVRMESLAMLDPALDEVGLRLSASDQIYEVMDKENQLANRNHLSGLLASRPEIFKEGNDLVIVFSVATGSDSELRVRSKII